MGFVTSGTFSPTLKQALAMALVAADAADGETGGRRARQGSALPHGAFPLPTGPDQG